jgi:dsDNA-specific endonuclease/ATPase MutS2
VGCEREQHKRYTQLRPEKFAEALVSEVETEIKELKEAFHATQDALKSNIVENLQATSGRLSSAITEYDAKVKALKRVSVPTANPKGKVKKPALKNK